MPTSTRPFRRWRSSASRRRLSLAIAIAAAMALGGPAAAADGSLPSLDEAPAAHTVPTAPTAATAPAPRTADFGGETASDEARRVADWAVHAGDNAGMPYVVIDKVEARVFVFDRNGRLQGAAPALIGMERGDGTAAGLGDRKLSAIAPQERTTPAGRFVASLGPDLAGQDILWIDYDSALALHRVAKGKPAERRAERLRSATATDNRISYGCINVAVPFYEGVVAPAFARSSGVVYILPEMRQAGEVFGIDGGAATGPSSGDAAR